MVTRTPLTSGGCFDFTDTQKAERFARTLCGSDDVAAMAAMADILHKTST